MEYLTPQIVISIITLTSGLIGVYINLNNKIIKLESQIEFANDHINELKKSRDEMGKTLAQILQTLNRIEGRLDHEKK